MFELDRAASCLLRQSLASPLFVHGHFCVLLIAFMSEADVLFKTLMIHLMKQLP